MGPCLSRWARFRGVEVLSALDTTVGGGRTGSNATVAGPMKGRDGLDPNSWWSVEGGRRAAAEQSLVNASAANHARPLWRSRGGARRSTRKSGSRRETDARRQ
jgi:hypothetical protein